MNMDEWHVMFARLLMLLAMACGLVGLVIGVVEREWRLGVTGWFTGGTLLAILSILILADHYVEHRKTADQRLAPAALCPADGALPLSRVAPR